MNLNILVVDDEEFIRDELCEALQDEGFETQSAGDGQAALDLARNGAFDLCISDIRMPVLDGIGLLKKLREVSPETMVIMMTAYAELQTAIDALRFGAVDYLLKPFKVEEILTKARRVKEHRRLVIENRNLKRSLEACSDTPVGGMIGESEPMKKIAGVIDRVASLPSSVLITGESGTGKELVARAIHDRGDRAKAPFVPINCAAIPETLLESELFGHVKGSFTGAVDNKEGLLRTAGEGTIFLDELGEMPLAVQAKLLRAIENREIQPVGSTRRIPIKARIIVATNKNLKEEAEAKRFREDLYFRLAVVELHVPPLRERREDIPLLVNHFVEKYNRELQRAIGGATSDALRRLTGYVWKGNVRELSNVIERAMIFADGDFLTPADLPGEVQGATPMDPETPLDLGEAVHLFEVEHITKVIRMCEGNKRKAAKMLGIGATSLYRKLGAKNNDENGAET
ncbi:MAG: sigma-54-dependent transcriptional regulator [Planctomycetota bacterium]|jgi:two-component system response regulator PilR (NtrC family)